MLKSVRSILVATDLSGNSDDIVRAAAVLAALSGAELHVLHDFEFEGKAYVAPEKQADTFQSRIPEAERALDAQIERTVRGRVPVASRSVVIFIAFKAIQERAREINADLLVLGRHRPRPVGNAFLGGTADRVIRSVDVPCLIVHGPLSLPLRRVVVPIDLSGPAFNALELALSWSGWLAPADKPAELIILHVIPKVFSFADVPIDATRVTAELHGQIEAARTGAPTNRVGEVREEVRWADSPAEEIQRVAQAENADLIVMGTHGHGALKRALIGSVAGAVARGASCPVLLVPPALWDAEST